MTARIGRSAVLARDIYAAAAFYEEVFGFRTLFEGEIEGYPLLHVGPGRLTDPGLWIQPAGGAPVGRQAGRGPALVLYLDDLAELEAVLERCARYGVERSTPMRDDDETTERYAHVSDIDGNEIVLAVLVDERTSATAGGSGSGGAPGA